jgi:DNA polymerase IV
MNKERKIIHVDMDCFFAAIEIRDNPDLKGKPVAVGGDADRRGVLCTCNYEARQYGLHSAMATAHARKLCPDLIVLPVNMRLYKDVSHGIREIFLEYCPRIEPLSLDEAFLDATENPHCLGSATWVAEEIRARIFQEHQITASAGVAPNKFLAKIASDWNKPNGTFVIKPEAVADFMLQLPVEKIFGVGKVTAQKMHDLDLNTCGDLQQLSLLELSQHFGKFGERLYQLSRGEDDRPVVTEHQRKSLSVEHTYEHDLPDLPACLNAVEPLYDDLIARLGRAEHGKIAKQFVKIKFNDFTQTTVECVSHTPHRKLYDELLKDGFGRADKAVRLLGLGVRFAEDKNQMAFEF